MNTSRRPRVPPELHRERYYVNFRAITDGDYLCSTASCIIAARWILVCEDGYLMIMYHCHQHLLQYAQYVFERYNIVLQAIE